MNLQRIKAPSPLLLPALAWAGGMFAWRFLGNPNPAISLLMLASALLCAIWIPKSRVILLLLAISGCGALRLYHHETGKTALREAFGDRNYSFQRIEVLIIRPISAMENAYLAKIKRIGNTEVSEVIPIYASKSLNPGYKYSALAEIIPTRADPVLDLHHRPYHAKAYLKGSIEIIDSTGFGKYSAANIRQMGMNSLKGKLGDYAPMAQALLFGDTELKRDWNERLSRAGIMHLVVVSGMHVWMIYLIFMVILNLVLPRRIAEALFIFLILVFAALNNWSAPIFRAVIMISLYIFASWMQRPVNGTQILALAFIIITAINPAELFGIGLQLSFASVAIILWMLPILDSLFWAGTDASIIIKAYKSLAKSVSLSLIISLGIIPLTLLYFGRATLNGVLGNLLGVPIVMLLVPLSFILWVLPQGTLVFGVFLNSYVLLCDTFEQWVQYLGELPLYWEALYPDPIILFAVALIVLSAVLFIKKKRAYALVTFGIFVLAILPYLYYKAYDAKNHLQITVYNAGVADCSLIELPSGERIMVDTGVLYPRRDTTGMESLQYFTQESWMHKRLLPILLRKGVKTIDYLVVTHMHLDHCGGVPAIMNALEVKNILVTDETLAHPLWQDWQRWALFDNSTVHAITDTISYRFADACLKFLHPDAQFNSTSENDRSLVFRLDFASKAYLFSGDVEAPAEDYLIKRYADELNADYIKVPHHGSKGSSQEEFVRVVSPVEAWITSSAKNKFGFPNPEALRVYAKYNSRVAVTHKGTIVHRQKKH